MAIAIAAVVPASAVGDKAILDAFEARRNEFASTYRLPDMPQEQEDAYFKRVEAYEAVIYQTPATTIAGAIVKLRVDFMGRVGTDWSDHAIMDPAEPIFVEGLAGADMFTRHAWSVIEDLTRIAGTTSTAWDDALAAVENAAVPMRETSKAFHAMDATWCADAGQTPENSTAWDAAWSAYSVALDRYHADLRSLVITIPAPNMAAALIKAQLVLDAQLNDDKLTEHVAADLRRFSNYANQER